MKIELGLNMKLCRSLSLFVTFASLFSNSLSHSEHSFRQQTHSNHDDHVAFLGEKLAKEFEKLSPQESRRRLR